MIREWWNGRDLRRERRQAMSDAHVHCEGDEVSMGWSGVAMDVDICGKEGCTMPSGGPCLASVERDRRYAELCELRGITP